VSRRFPLVLCYHAVTAAWQHALAVEAGTLLRQVQGLLGRGYEPVSADEVLRADGRALHVTFDDAFRGILEVLPALNQLGVHATVFACTGLADGGRPLAVPELAADLAALPYELLTLRWDELRGLAESGSEIGSHTVSHPHLTRLGDAELERELRESRERIEAELGKPCRLVSYPFGEEDARVRAAAKAAGYDAAFLVTTRRGPRDDYALPRVSVYHGDGALRLRAKTAPLRRALPRR
jgi:peptidoglycan/xylan/chitin deacetylase (PgdA/CDA1 family)